MYDDGGVWPEQEDPSSRVENVSVNRLRRAVLQYMANWGVKAVTRSAVSNCGVSSFMQ